MREVSLLIQLFLKSCFRFFFVPVKFDIFFLNKFHNIVNRVLISGEKNVDEVLVL